MDKKDAGGESLRQTLEAVRKQKGVMPAEGVCPHEMPAHLWQLWGYFLQLQLSRPSDPTTGADQPFTESEVGWFFKNRRLVPEVWELDALRLLDFAYRNPSTDLLQEQEEKAG